MSNRFVASTADSIVVLKDVPDITIDGIPQGKPDKVMPTLEEALKQVIIEWKD
jgi:hypothetical protein